MEQALEPNHLPPSRSSRASAMAVTFTLAPRLEGPAIAREDLLLDSGYADAFETFTSMGPSRPRELFELFLELWGEPPSGLELHEIGPLDGSARLVLTHAESGDACWERLGFLHRGLHLLGAMTVRVSEVECRSNGADACVYECDWSSFA